MAGPGDLQGALSAARFEAVASVLDAQELQSAEADKRQRRPDARFVWKRLPDALKQERAVTVAFQVLQAMWNKDYQGVWQALNGHEWSGDLAPLAAALAQKVRAHNAELISRAYTSIAPAKAAALLGLREAEAAELAERDGWGRRDAATGLITVSRPPRGGDERVSVEHLARLTQYVTHLEAS